MPNNPVLLARSAASGGKVGCALGFANLKYGRTEDWPLYSAHAYGDIPIRGPLAAMNCGPAGNRSGGEANCMLRFRILLDTFAPLAHHRYDREADAE